MTRQFELFDPDDDPILDFGDDLERAAWSEGYSSAENMADDNPELYQMYLLEAINSRSSQSLTEPESDEA